MSSAKQVHANRLNAKSSSGPKTEQGKRASALNATRHGLSSPLAPSEHAQSIDAIAALLENELGSLAAARGVAIKILDYERNEAQQRVQLQAMARGPEPELEGAALIQATRAAYPEYDTLLEYVQEEIEYDAGLSQGELLEVATLLKGMRGEVSRSHARASARAEREAHNSLRYLKRSANQLVKALRSAAGAR